MMFSNSHNTNNHNIFTSLLIVEVLKLLKNKHDYKELSKITGLPVSTLTRYITNKTLPRGSKLNKLLASILKNTDVNGLIKENIRVNGKEIDLSGIVSDITAMKFISLYVINEFIGNRITSILAIDQEGIPLATSIGLFMERRVFFLSDKSPFNSDYNTRIMYYVKETGEYKIYWLHRSILNRNENVLLVAGILRNSSLIKQLYDKISGESASFGGLFSLVSFSKTLNEIGSIPVGKKVTLMVI